MLTKFLLLDKRVRNWIQFEFILKSGFEKNIKKMFKFVFKKYLKLEKNSILNTDKQLYIFKINYWSLLNKNDLKFIDFVNAYINNEENVEN